MKQQVVSSEDEIYMTRFNGLMEPYKAYCLAYHHVRQLDDFFPSSLKKRDGVKFIRKGRI